MDEALINGQLYSWADVSITLPYGGAVNIDEISYSDKQDTEVQYGKGETPVGYSKGNYSAEGKMSLSKEEFNKLNMYAAQSGGIYRLKPFLISVNYANDDQGTTTDILDGCLIVANSLSIKQGDKGTKHELSLTIMKPIKWGGIEAVTASSSSLLSKATGALTVASNVSNLLK